MTDEWVARFLRGLTIGALIGAVIAGSRVWTRWRVSVPGRPAVSSAPSPTDDTSPPSTGP